MLGKLRALVLAVVCGGSLSIAAQQATVDWTVMMYLNGDNSLEGDIIDDLLECAKVPASSSVTIVAQLDRTDAPGSDTRFEDWSNTFRFVVTPGLRPIRSAAVVGFDEESDMGVGSTAAAFVKWAMKEHPARHYALVIGSHGDGWRLFRTTSPMGFSAEMSFDGQRALGSFSSVPIVPIVVNADMNPVRSCSEDASSGHALLNRDLADSIKDVVPVNTKLDVLAFDACLMGMVEVAYAFRDVADVVVASEQEEPGSGFDQTRWISRLLSHSGTAGAEDLGRDMVAAYADAYRAEAHHGVRNRTLVAWRESRVDSLKISIDTFAKLVIPKLKDIAVVTAIRTARDSAETFGGVAEDTSGCSNSIDLASFLDRLIGSTSDPEIVGAAKDVEAKLALVVIAAYADVNKDGDDLGAQGVAIYFPKNTQNIRIDPLSGVYDSAVSVSYPVAFVKDTAWPAFIRSYAAARDALLIRSAGAVKRSR